jgi:hypothetical protein
MASLTKLPPSLNQLNRTLTDFRPLFENAILPDQADIDQLIIELKDAFGRSTPSGLQYWKVQLGEGARSLLGGPAGAEAPGGGASPVAGGGGARPAAENLFSVLFGG